MPVQKTDELNKIIDLITNKKILSLESMTKELRCSERTVQRYLKGARCVTSYTHKRQFVTLANTPSFDHNGVWFYQGVGFSTYGNSLDAVIGLINRSKNGFSREELEFILKISLSKQMQILRQREKIQRIKVGNKYLYVPDEAFLDRSKKLKIVENRQNEEHFESGVKISDLVALLKVTLLENKIRVDLKSISHLAKKHFLLLPLKKIEQLLVAYELPEKKSLSR